MAVINPKDRHKIIPAVYLILIKDEQILLTRRYQTGHLDGFYSVPAGHLDGNESLAQALCREVREEVDLEIKLEDLELVHVINQLKALGGERVDFYFQTKAWQGEPKIMEPHKCDDLRWFALDRLPANLAPYVRQAIENIQKGHAYSEFSQTLQQKL